MRRTKRKQLYNSGFTLIELMIVIVVLGLLAMIMVPQCAS
jgi:prepilin-type N-terminal cleavage/methylation domain-containing protein